MYIRSRKCARKYSERYDHGPEILIGKIDPGFIQQNPSRASLSDSHVQSEAWETEDLQVTPWGLSFWDSPLKVGGTGLEPATSSV